MKTLIQIILILEEEGKNVLFDLIMLLKAIDMRYIIPMRIIEKEKPLNGLKDIIEIPEKQEKIGKKVRPFWDGSQEFNIEYLLFALAPIALVIATYLGFVSGENRKRNDIIDKKYKALIEEPYINYKKNEALTKDPYIIYRDPHSIEGLNEITFFEAKSVIRLREVTHELANTINFSKNASTLEKYLQQQIKEAQGKDSAEGILVTKDEISVIKYNFKNKKKELRGKAVDGYKSFETTKLGAPISEAIKFQNIKNYSKNLLANAKLPNSNPIFNTKNLQKMIKR